MTELLRVGALQTPTPPPNLISRTLEAEAEISFENMFQSPCFQAINKGVGNTDCLLLSNKFPDYV